MRASASATARSWAGSRSACSRHTATASTPAGIAGTRRRRRLRSRDRARRAGRRPRTAGRAATSGAGRSANGSYSDGRAWRAISITSANPRVVTSATRAPAPLEQAFVATVVPWASSSADARRAPPDRAQPAARASGRPASTAPSTTRPSSATRSVNVPPVSTPTRMRSSVAAHCRRRKLRLGAARRRRSRRPRRPVRTPPVTASITALCRLTQLPAVPVGHLEAVGRLAFDRADAGRVHVDAGAGKRRRDRMEQPGRSTQRTSHSVYHGDASSSKTTSAPGVGGASSGRSNASTIAAVSASASGGVPFVGSTRNDSSAPRPPT